MLIKGTAESDPSFPPPFSPPLLLTIFHFAPSPPHFLLPCLLLSVCLPLTLPLRPHVLPPSRRLTCDGLEEPADVEQALLQDALEAHAEDGDAGHTAQHQRPRRQEQHGGLPEAAGHLAEGVGVGPAAHAPRPDVAAAAVQAQGRPVLHRRVGARGTQQPIGAHEGDELGEGHHDAEQRPQHGAARHDDVAHGGGEGGGQELCPVGGLSRLFRQVSMEGR